MPQLLPFVLKDEAAANVSFNPIRNTVGGAAETAARPNGSIALQTMLTIFPRMDKTRNTSGVKLKITVPVIRNIDTVDTVVENILVDLDIRFPNIASAAERDRAIALIASCVDSTQVPMLVPVLRGTETLW